MPFPSVPKIAPVCVILAASFAPGNPALADGTFLQFDIGESTTGLVGSVTRDRLTYAANYTEFDGGNSIGAGVTWSLPMSGGVVIKGGPSFGYTQEDDGADRSEIGVKLSAERFTPMPFGSLYLLGEVNSVENAWFLIAQTGYGDSGFGAELSRGSSDTYLETTLALTQRLDGGPTAVRGGYAFDSESFFVGLSFNNF